MTKSSRKIRIGKINYTNVWPIFHYFEEELCDEVEWIHAVPAHLNAAIQKGEIDLAPISSFAYGKNSHDYALLADLSVSALGKVSSILLFHKVPIEQLDGRKIALTNTSATSTHLLKIILDKHFNITPEYAVVRPYLDEMLAAADAALLIGDDAIRASWDAPAGCEVTDLGQLWHDMTGHWMSFALWAVRKETIEQHPEAMQAVYDAFLRSKERMKENNTPIIEQAVKKIGGTRDYWEQYFNGLSHDFGQAQQDGISLYYRYAHELQFIEHEVKLNIWAGNRPAIQKVVKG